MSLEKRIIEEIERDGPMGVDRFMALCVAEYYATRDPFGKAGDFVTAPEISQMFGEVLGAWVAQSWMDMGRPERFILLECGPGRGTLMADMLRASAGVEGFHAACDVHLLEASAVLREAQETALKDYKPVWHETLESVSRDLPILVVANEFFDALPVRQEVRVDGVWRERLITADLEWDIAPDKNEDIREVSPVREGGMADLSKRMMQSKGAAIIIDYGHAKAGYGDTLQAVKDHQPACVFSDVGEADLTAHVDFEALGRVARDVGIMVEPLMEQGAFLKALGIEARAAYLKQKGAKDIEADLHRLIAPDAMGKLFKVMVSRYGY